MQGLVSAGPQLCHSAVVIVSPTTAATRLTELKALDAYEVRRIKQLVSDASGLGGRRRTRGGGLEGRPPLRETLAGPTLADTGQGNRRYS